jgi:hypothetical protein
MCTSGHEVAQVGDGVTLLLVCPFAGARTHLGALRGHHDPSLLPAFGSSTRFDSPLATHAVSLLLVYQRKYAELAEVSSITESTEMLLDSKKRSRAESRMY